MARFLVVMLVAACAAALTTPHHARSGAVQHAGLAARLSSPAPVTPLVKQRIRRSKRCPQAPLSSTSTAAASKPTSTAAQTSSVPINAAPKPTSSAAPKPTSTAAPKPTSTEAPKPTSTAAPKPTSTEAPKPTTPKTTAPPKTTNKPTTAAPKPTSSSAPAPASPGVCGPRSLTGTMSGDGTFFNTGLGACGKTTSDDDLIVAVSQDLYDTFPGAGANPNLNPICNKKIQAHYNGKSVTVTVVDRCVGCACGSLDFSPAAFEKLADFSLGRLSGVTWNFV